MSKSKQASYLSQLQDHLIAARDLLVSPNPIDTAQNPVRFNVAGALRNIGESAEALSLYEAILAAQPSHAGALRARVDVETEAGTLEAAADYVAEALAQFPNDPDLQIKQADLLRRLGRTAEANAVLTSFLEDLPVNPAIQVRIANQFVALSDFAAAYRLFGHVLASNPGNENALLGRVNIALQQNEPSLAIVLCDFGINSLPDNAVLRQKKAEGLRKTGRETEAVEILEDLSRNDPENISVRMSLARSLRALGRRNDARVIYSEILDANPSHRGALLDQIDMALASGDTDEALRCCDTALGHHTDDEGILIKKANTLARGARHLDALTILEPLRKKAPVGSPLHRQTARTALSAGKLEEAERIFKELLEVDPDDRKALMGLAEIAERRGDVDDALTLLERVLGATG